MESGSEHTPWSLRLHTADTLPAPCKHLRTHHRGEHLELDCAWQVGGHEELYRNCTDVVWMHESARTQSDIFLDNESQCMENTSGRPLSPLSGSPLSGR
jgi:hypothetical protein